MHSTSCGACATWVRGFTTCVVLAACGPFEAPAALVTPPPPPTPTPTPPPPPTPTPTPEEAVRWVGPNGSAAGDGLTPQTAFANVSEAVASMRSSRMLDGEIRVCTGTYRAPTIVLDYPVSLLGGFDCATGKRSANFGRKGNYASASRFVHEAALGLVLDVVAGVEREIQSSNVIEGLEFAFDGPTAKTTVTTVQIRAGAVTLRNCKVVSGASTTNNETGAIALQLDGKTKAQILSNDIESVPTTALYGNGF